VFTSNKPVEKGLAESVTITAMGVIVDSDTLMDEIDKV
jgi:hypothetical protein